MRTGSARIAVGARQVALTVGAVAGALCILVTVAAFAFGVRPLVFQSGSMSPTIDTGALAISRETGAEDLRVGDIVSVPTPGGNRVTHRIVAVDHLDHEAVLQLKGDANDAPDATSYRIDHADVVLFAVPQVGYVLGWLGSPVGIFALGTYAAFLFSVVMRGATGRRPAPVVAADDVPLPAGSRRRTSDARHRGTRPALALPFAAVLRRRKSDPRHRRDRPVIVRPVAAVVRRRTSDARHRSARPTLALPLAAVLRRRKSDPRHRRDRPVIVLPVAAVIRRRTSDTRHRSARPTLALPLAAVSVALTAITLVAGTLALGWTDPTLAAFTDPGTVSGTTQAAYTVPAPATGTCVGSTSVGNGVVTLKWPANAAPLPTLSYDPIATGLTSSTPALSINGTNQQLTVTYSTTTAGNQNKTVTVTATGYPTATHSWLGPTTTWKFKSAGSFVAPTCGEVNPPTGTIKAPDGTTRTRSAEQTFLSSAAGCGAAGRILCGTMADASTITNVDYILQRTVVATVRCWTGTWTTNCTTYQAATISSQTGYNAAGTTSTVYNTAGSYVLTVRITDTWANVTTLSVSFTLT